MVKTIALIATLDTKGAEAKYVKEQIEAKLLDILTSIKLSYDQTKQINS